MYKTPAMVDDVFADAKAANFNVLRTWGFLDIGTQADSADGVYFQFWDGAKPAYNDGADGLEHLDYVLAAAGRAGIKLVIPLTNNWSDFGGMDQYVRWRGGQYHDDFYTDATIRGWYKDWISHVLNRTNTLTGVEYKDDPTIDDVGAGQRAAVHRLRRLPAVADLHHDDAGRLGRAISAATSSPSTATTWSASGDEGFLCTDPASSGLDHQLRRRRRRASRWPRLPAVDVMSFHLYPDGWGKDAAWGVDWIKLHATLARRIDKPVMLGRVRLPGQGHPQPGLPAVGATPSISAGVDGFLYWILSGVQDDGTLYPDYDGFTVYCPSPVCTTLSNAGEELRGGQRSRTRSPTTTRRRPCGATR